VAVEAATLAQRILAAEKEAKGAAYSVVDSIDLEIAAAKERVATAMWAQYARWFPCSLLMSVTASTTQPLPSYIFGSRKHETTVNH